MNMRWLCLFLLLFPFSCSAHTLFQNPNRPLVYGDKNPDVSKLQSFLIADGEDIPAGPTGYFGEQTKAAVSVFQLKYSFQILFPLGLSAPTGAVYSATRAQIEALYSNY